MKNKPYLSVIRNAVKTIKAENNVLVYKKEGQAYIVVYKDEFNIIPSIRRLTGYQLTTDNLFAVPVIYKITLEPV